MSRIGYAVIEIPQGVEVNISPENVVSVKGPKGELHETISSLMKVEIKDNELNVKRTDESKEQKSLHGLSRALINNMVVGVNEGYKKELELVGVGFRASNNGQLLELALGYSHNTIIELPKEIKVSTVSERGKSPIVTLESHDKQLIGHVAAKIRSLRKPEPYKGKGIRFVGEHIRRKAGKAAAAK